MSRNKGNSKDVPSSHSQTKIYSNVLNVIDKIADWEIWKWVYFCGIGLAGVIFLSNLYNLAVVCLADFNLLLYGYKYIYKGFLSFHAAKVSVYSLINSMIIFVLPSFLSLFVKREYFYKIVYIVVLTFVLLIMMVIIYRVIL